MVKTIFAVLGALVAFGGLMFLIALMAYKYECRRERRKGTTDG